MDSWTKRLHGAGYAASKIAIMSRHVLCEAHDETIEVELD